MTPEDLAREIAAEAAGTAPSVQMTGEQVAEFNKRFEEQAVKRSAHRAVVLPSRPKPVTPDELRAFAREFAVVVRPGETLVIRMGNDYTPSQLRELHEALNHPAMELPFRVLVVPGEDFAVAQGAEHRICHEHSFDTRLGTQYQVRCACGRVDGGFDRDAARRGMERHVAEAGP
jgi:hypothetical protein